MSENSGKLTIDTREVRVLKADPSAHEEMQVPLRDWHRIHDAVDGLKEALPHRVKDSTTWGVTFASLGAGFFAGLVPVLSGTKNPAAWVVAYYVCFGVIFCFGALLCFIFGGQRKKVGDVIDKICTDMDDIEGFNHR